MKKFFSLILVAMLELSPIYSLAAEDTQALPPTTSETPAEAAVEAPAPAASTEAPATEAPASEAPAQGSETDGAITTETPSTEQLNTDTTTDVTSDDTKKTEGESSETKTDEDKKTEETSDKKSADDKEKPDLEKDSEEKLEEYLEKEKLEEDLEKEKLEEDEEEDKDKKEKGTIPEHEHEFEYTSNKDGTHIVKCIAPVIKEKADGEERETEEVPCDFEAVEECAYDEDGVCVYCGYVKPKEEPKFEPNVSLSINNSSCTIGETNPIICMSISAEDFDVEYAQICLANYSQNKFINVGLAQGKYFDYKADDFVYTGSGSWYASPDITDDYPQGNYTVRSVYIRSTTGEAVHYSVESGNLPAGYQNYSIELARPTGMSLIKDIFSPSSNDINTTTEEPMPEERFVPELSGPDSETRDTIEVEEPAIEEDIAPEPEAQAPSIEEPVVDSPAVEKAITEEPKVSTSEEVTTAPVETTPKAEEPVVTEASQTNEPTVKKQPKTEEPKATETTSSSGANRSNATNNSSNNQNSRSNSILNFFKKLFGIK